jgi:hypothetical protein
VDSTLADTLDAGDAADGMIRFDAEQLTGMGQSMGSTLGVPWISVDPRAKGFVASGAGGVLVEIAISAIEPYELRPILEYRLGLENGDLTEAHPLLNAFQNLWDLVDPIAKAPHAIREPFPGIEPTPVLMTAGVRDGYFHPRAEAAMAVALGVPQIGEEVEPILPDSLRLAGYETLAYPQSDNVNGVTAGVIQYAAPNDLGHYVAFNQEGARHQYTCFLKSFGDADGPVIRQAAGGDGPCE